MALLLWLDEIDDAYYGQVWVGHKITPDADWSVEDVWHERFFALVANGCTCYIYADSGDEPTGSVLATSNVVNGMATTDAGAPATFTFPTPYIMTSGVSYWFVWHVPAQQCFFWYDTGNSYPAGSIGYSTHATEPVGNWITNGTYQASGMKVNGEIYIPVNPVTIGGATLKNVDIGG
ncbi:MAG: hypothetical protein KAS36_01045 [Anaerolineales bacterium]|nr:hypothetical protein [Anaerolineales bacterium]